MIGVAQLLNKQDGPFTIQDEHLFDAFGVYCGLSLTAVGMYEDLQKSDAKNHVTMDVLSFHACASEEEANQMSKINVPTANRFGLLSLDMDVKALSKKDTAVACLRMFADMGFIHTFKIPYQSLCRWILSVQNNYREVAYHNWHHAFNVTQAMYAILMKADLKMHLSPLERMGLIISCTCTLACALVTFQYAPPFASFIRCIMSIIRSSAKPTTTATTTSECAVQSHQKKSKKKKCGAPFFLRIVFIVC